MKCPYCNDEKKPRGLKNHVRMSGGEHGESGSVPADYEDRIAETEAEDAENDEANDADSDENGAQSDAERPDDEATTVGPSDFENDAESDESDAESDDGVDAENVPFDPSDDGAIRLDGGESLTVVADDGSLVEATASEGDYLLIDEDEGMAALYDVEDAVLYEVKTA